jgi:hypothetical protein
MGGIFTKPFVSQMKKQKEASTPQPDPSFNTVMHKTGWLVI